MALDDVRGRGVRIRMDLVDAAESSQDSVRGTVIAMADLEPDATVLAVRLDGVLADKLGSPIRDILVAGIGMNVVTELFAMPSRPAGLPVLIGVWRLGDAESFQTVLAQRKPPPSVDFLGRAEITLDKS